ncbi:hypothetical protein Sez_0782 [Streptococcus equi subsp. zooepidemicus MGCS10565]|uniref:Uncharacterized protein n=1 Tax=Streptococcus equi subsp. zooepidemicus (strain MGCS10565) TaxID=552526 RepID=B4U2C5_STREM|nr:hypothetical protein Sez_0782 [Streptococcus equi subsp. zooepidemicus MGCS10565]
MQGSSVAGCAWLLVAAFLFMTGFAALFVNSLVLWYNVGVA